MFCQRILRCLPPLSILGMVLALVLIQVPVLAQETEEEELPDVKKLCTDVEKEYKNRKSRDVARIEAIYDTFVEYYEKVSPKDQKQIVKTLRKAYDTKPPITDRHFLVKAAGCLSGMGKAGADALLTAVKGKALVPKDRKDDLKEGQCRRIKGIVIEAMGETKEPSVIKPVSKLLWNDHSDIIKAACKALGKFNELSILKRKPIVEELVKVYANLDAQAKLAIKDPKVSHYRDRLIAVEVSFNESLKKLTNQSYTSAPEWQKWYNNNKGKKKW